MGGYVYWVAFDDRIKAVLTYVFPATAGLVVIAGVVFMLRLVVAMRPSWREVITGGTSDTGDKSGVPPG